jgi:hypothetical protein
MPAGSRRKNRDESPTPSPYFSLMVLPLAHVGHWAMWVLYLVPVVIVLAASVNALVQQRRENREQGRG